MTKTNQKIPEGWSVKKIEELGQVVTGSTPPMSNPENYGGDICWATAKDFAGKYILDTAVHLSEKGKKFSRIIPNGSVLVTCIASIGLNAIAKTQMATNQQINSIIVNEENNNEFIYYQITKNTALLKKYAGDSALPIISKSCFEKIRFLIPPLAEQEKIAEILGTWDTAIEKLSALIEQKKQLKKGLMQRLLTGKQRLPGFSAPWKKVKLGDVALLFSGGTPSKEEPLYWENGHIKWLSAKYIENDKIIGWDYITDEGLEKSSAKTTQVNDIILVTRVSVGKIYFCQESYAVNQDLTVIRAKNISSNFLFFLIKNKQNLIIDKSQGLAIKGITKEELSNISFLLPPLPEQKAIADILSKADEEIALLTRKLSALKTQKTGLVQKLLTGQIRVKVA